MTLKASVAFFSFPSDNVPVTRQFFQNLFGIDFEPALSDEQAYHAPVAEGIDLNIGQRHAPQETPTAFIAVDDLNAAISLATGAGGKVVWGPASLAIPINDYSAYKNAVMELDNVTVTDNNLAQAAIVLEAGGSQVGLVQLADHAEKHFNAGKFRQPLSDYRLRQQQLTANVVQATGRS